MWNGLLGLIPLLYYILYVNEILQKSVDAKDYNIQWEIAGLDKSIICCPSAIS